MHYVKKGSPPVDFIKKTEGKTNWEQLKHYKRKLKKHILESEQAGLCIYCEIRVNLDNSHCEHLYPKSKYPQYTFEYNNITISCNGNCGYYDNRHHFCGHVKANYFDKDKFLNPNQLKDIETYFSFDLNSGKILSSGKDDNKANYMIDGLLLLNDAKLCQERLNSVRALLKVMKRRTFNSNKDRLNTLRSILQKKDLQFQSFLKYKYKKYVR